MWREGVRDTQKEAEMRREGTASRRQTAGEGRERETARQADRQGDRTHCIQKHRQTNSQRQAYNSHAACS